MSWAIRGYFSKFTEDDLLLCHPLEDLEGGERRSGKLSGVAGGRRGGSCTSVDA